MLRYLLPPLLLLYSDGSLARGCQEAPRFYSVPTVVSVTSDDERPLPGQEVTINALVEAPAGAFSVFCYNPDASTQRNGGVVNIYANSILIATRQIAPENTHSVYLLAYYDIPYPGYVPANDPAYLFRYYGFNTSSYSVKFRMPETMGPSTFSATFSGDRQFAAASASAPLVVKSAARDSTPIIMYLLN